jgi:hypothetical protein
MTIFKMRLWSGRLRGFSRHNDALFRRTTLAAVTTRRSVVSDKCHTLRRSVAESSPCGEANINLSDLYIDSPNQVSDS